MIRIKDLAFVVVILFEQGNIEPTAEEIIEYYTGRKPTADEVEWMRRNLWRVRKSLDDKGFDVYLYNEAYYFDSNRDPENLDVDPSTCVPGRGILSYGIRWKTTKIDLIWHVTQQYNHTSSAGKINKVLVRSERLSAIDLLDDDDTRDLAYYMLSLLANRPPGVLKDMAKELTRIANGTP